MFSFHQIRAGNASKHSQEHTSILNTNCTTVDTHEWINGFEVVWCGAVLSSVIILERKESWQSTTEAGTQGQGVAELVFSFTGMTKKKKIKTGVAKP